jgi:hypothetical protein
MSDTVRRLAACVAVAVCLALLPACTVESLADALARHDCRGDAPTRVSADRTAVLFVDTHLYLPEGTADRTPYTTYANDVIPATLDDVNAYLESAGVNMLLAMHAGDLTENAAMAPVELSSGGIPLGTSRETVKNAAREAPKNVQSHWSPSSNQPNVAGYGGGEFDEPDSPYPLMWHGMIENPAGSLSVQARRTRTFAHELGHYFGLIHRDDLADNLMKTDSTGRELLAEQIATMWDTLNRLRPNLAVISCRRDPALRQIVRDHSGDEISRTQLRDQPRAAGAAPAQLPRR